MKSTYLTLITIFIFAFVHAQETISANQSVVALKTYLSRQIRFPAVTAEQYIQGRVLVAFKIDSGKHITDIRISKPLADADDNEVVRALKAYTKDIMLPPTEYTVGIQFLIENKKLKRGDTPIDVSNYQNFLFDLNVIANFPY